MLPSVAEVEKLLRPAPLVLEIGPGIHPQNRYATQTYLAIEPHNEYVEVLVRNELLVLQATAAAVLPMIPRVDTILLIDVLEHMPREVGLFVLEQCMAKARKQVAVFTPVGFQKQDYRPGEKDAWGMNGTYWQTHRSGWQPEDFPKWTVGVSKNFHGEGLDALYAIYEVANVQ